MANGHCQQPTTQMINLARLGVVLSVCMFAGCNGHRPGLPMNASLKTALSQTQFENETLKAKIAKLEKQNRLLVADLQREETYSGTLAARLDESRNILRRNGVDVPLDVESPRIIAKADDNSANRLTFGQVSTPSNRRRSKYASALENEDEQSLGRGQNNESDFPRNDRRDDERPKTLSPPGFSDESGFEESYVPELGANDLSTGWRRLSYRNMNVPIKE